MKASFFTLALLLGSLCSSHAMELNFTDARVTFNPSQKFFQVQKQNQPSTMISVIPGESAKFLQVEIRDSVLSIDTGKFFSNGGKEVYLHQFRHTWSDPGSREGRFSAEMAASPDGSKIKLVFHGKNFWKEKIFPRCSIRIISSFCKELYPPLRDAPRSLRFGAHGGKVPPPR